VKAEEEQRALEADRVRQVEAENQRLKDQIASLQQGGGDEGTRAPSAGAVGGEGA
jgi:hypothetical protein